MLSLRSILPMLVGFFVFFVGACANKTSEKGQSASQNNTKTDQSPLTVPLKTFSDEQYPYNPDIGLRSKQYGQMKLDSLRVKPSENDPFVVDILAKDQKQKSQVQFSGLNLYEMIPAWPKHIKGESYLEKIALINQEWNRQQVRFPIEREEVSVTPPKQVSQTVTRVDLARNCLNTQLWELFVFGEEDGKEKQLYHGWFDFPRSLFVKLLERKSGTDFETYEDHLLIWKDPESKPVELDKLRKVIKEKQLSFENFNDQMYPKKGGLKKKYQNILYPENPNKIQDFLTDSTRFATFAKPGLYDQDQPRKTRLGRLAKPQQLTVRKTETRNKASNQTLEWSLSFTDAKGDRQTSLVIGGIDWDELPKLSPEKLHKGWKMPMGIGNHSFYESIAQMQAYQADQSPYFGLLLDGKGRFLDSHKVGIDGPIFFREKGNPKNLHMAILSFERHAIVGHYAVNISDLDWIQSLNNNSFSYYGEAQSS